MLPNINYATVVSTSVHGLLIGGMFLGPLAHKPEPESPRPALPALLTPVPDREFALAGLLIPSSTDARPEPQPPGAINDPTPLDLPVASIDVQTANLQDVPDVHDPNPTDAPVPDARDAPTTDESVTAARATDTAVDTRLDKAPTLEPPLASPSTDATSHPMRTALATRGGATPAAGRSRAPRHVTVAPTSVRTVYEHVDLDMGAPGAADGLLYGAGSPGWSKDRASPPRIGGYVRWECPWPVAADRYRINHAIVHVTADVTAEGKATAVQLIDEPGYEFGPDSVQCALKKNYVPGSDPLGRPVAGRTLPFSLHFNRADK
jgi:hypothetical protein